MKKKTKLFMTLLVAVFVVALGTGILTNGVANKVNSSETTVVAANIGGNVPADIVFGLILVDTKAQTLVAINERPGQLQIAATPILPAGNTIIETVINKTEIPTATMLSSMIGTQPNGSGGNPLPVENVFTSATAVTPTAATVIAAADSSGGNFFHAGKMLASNSVESGAAGMTSIAT